MTQGPIIAGLVLAAGESSRMGRDKALLPYRGRTFVETIVAKLREAGIASIAVVLGHHADEIRRAVTLPGVDVVINRDYMRGQTSSLQKGLAAFEASPGTEAEAINAILLCLVDHPAFESSTVSVLIEAFARTRAAITQG